MNQLFGLQHRGVWNDVFLGVVFWYFIRLISKSFRNFAQKL